MGVPPEPTKIPTPTETQPRRKIKIPAVWAIRIHTDALTALTRLRVLASADVVACAEKLQIADAHAYEIVVLERGNLPNATEWGELEELRMERRPDLRAQGVRPRSREGD